MKQLRDYKEDIYKCTKCGLCQSKCPIFEVTGIETAISRGKFTLLDGLLNGDISRDKNLSKYFDLCLNCKACEEFCPSGIKAEDIIIMARHYNYKKFGLPLKKRILLGFLGSKELLNLAKVFLDAYRFFNIAKITNFIKVLRVFNGFIDAEIKYKKDSSVKPKNKDLTITYYTGCLENYINPSIKNSVRIVLDNNGYKYSIPDFKCCNIAHRNSGDIENYLKNADYNIDLIDDNIDYILFSCPSCMSAFLDYEKYKTSEKFQKLKHKVVDINKLIIDENIEIPNKRLNIRTTYHDSCHLNRCLNVKNEPREIVKKLSDYNEMEKADMCCGAAGLFCFSYGEISRDITNRKAQQIQNSDAGTVLASCISCRLGLMQGIVNNNQKQKVLSPVELLAKSYID